MQAFPTTPLLGLLIAWCCVAVPARADDVQDLADRIDALIAERWSAEGVLPAPLSSDAEFMRRASLDLCGKIPPASAVRDFLADDSPRKRRDLIESLLASPSYVIHTTNLWRATMIPEAAADQQIRIVLPGFEAWLRSRIAENRSLAEIVEEVLTLPVATQDVAGFNQPERPTPAAFYRAKEGKPERLAAATARIFLGVRIDCAQCHHHPFDDWKQEQFWQHAAFFTDVPQQNPGVVEQAAALLKRGRISIPDTDQTVSARFLDGADPDWAESSSGRALLARWIVSADNPYFAQAAVNRIWSHHFGIGLVEPMDDFSPLNPPSHPGLLETLAQAFVSHGYDIPFLVRAITASRTYQLTSSQTDDSQADHHKFAKMPVRGMTPEQIFDSLAQAIGYRQPFDPEQPLNFNNDPVRQEFLATFGNQAESATERTATILQALSLMNGEFVTGATDLTDSKTLAAVIDAPFLDLSEQVDALFLSTLTRMPTPAERARLEEYVTGGGATNDPSAALSDIFWALLNSSEFLLNH